MDELDRRAYHSAKVMAECGFTDRAIQAVKQNRMAGSILEALDHASSAEEPRPHWSDTADENGPEWAALRAARAKNPLMNGRNEL